MSFRTSFHTIIAEKRFVYILFTHAFAVSLYMPYAFCYTDSVTRKPRHGRKASDCMPSATDIIKDYVSELSRLQDRISHIVKPW